MGCYLIGFRVIVVTIYLMGELTFLASSLYNPVEHILIEVSPFFKSKFFSEYSRGNITRN